jgi:hypothetical protein
MKINLELVLCSKEDPENPKRLRHLARSYFLENISLDNPSLSSLYTRKKIQIPEDKGLTFKIEEIILNDSTKLPYVEAIHEIGFYENNSNYKKIKEKINQYCNKFEENLKKVYPNSKNTTPSGFQ